MTAKESLTPAETSTIAALEAELVKSRAERAARVGRILELLANIDEPTRLVAEISARHYLDSETTAEGLNPHRTARQKAHWQAPGVFIILESFELKEKIMQTGEFVSTNDLVNCADTLGFKRTLGGDSAEFLYQWVASRNPESPAAENVRDLGLRSGRMSHDLYRKGDFYTRGLLFHTSVIAEYIDEIEAGVGLRHGKIDQVLCLAATDDWDRAQSLAFK